MSDKPFYKIHHDVEFFSSADYSSPELARDAIREFVYGKLDENVVEREILSVEKLDWGGTDYIKLEYIEIAKQRDFVE